MAWAAPFKRSCLFLDVPLVIHYPPLVGGSYRFKLISSLAEALNKMSCLYTE